MMLRNFSFCLLLTSGLLVSHAGAQCSAAPANADPSGDTYVSVCNQLQGYLNNFQATLNSQWGNPGPKSPATFSAELTSADSNQNIEVLTSPRTINTVNDQLDAFASVGVESVTFAVGFPILDPNFYAPNFNQGPPQQDMQTILTFYKNVIAAARQRGMRVLIESSVLFPDKSDLPLAAYYSTLIPAGAQPPYPALNAGRATVAQTVATELQPDWLNLGSEPDTQSALLGLNTPMTPTDYAAEISQIVSQLRAAGVHGRPLIGAGVGTWSQEAPAYISAEVGIDLDYIDFHVYSINHYATSTASTLDFLGNAPAYIDMAHAAGKGAAVSEFWMKKVSDLQLAGKTDLGVEGQFSNSTTGSIDTFSFWDPLDAQFVTEMTELANWKNLYYVSPFPTQFFYAYLSYSQVANESPSFILSQETMAEANAFGQSPVPLSATGQAYQTVVFATPTMLSAASSSAPVAPESLIALYGRGGNLASSTQIATSQPLPTNLGNVSVTLFDSAGTSMSLPLLFVSTGQINGEIPPGLHPGVAQLVVNGVTTPSGSITSSVNLTTVAPGIFTANQTGSGVPAAQVVTNLPDGTQATTDVFNTGCTPGNCAPAPIDLSAGPSALVLYGTGIRNRNSINDVTVQVGSQTIPALYAGLTSGYTGLDQVNIALPSSLAGSGTVNVTVNIAGTPSNTVTVAFK